MKFSKIVCILVSIIAVTYLTGSIVIGKICLFGILLLCIYLGNKERAFINPFYLFSITPFSLLIYYNMGDAYMIEITSDTIVLAAMNMIAFICSFYGTQPFARINNCVSILNKNFLIITSIFFYSISVIAHIVKPLESILWVFSIPAMTCAIKTKKKIMFLFVAIMFAFAATGITSKTEMLIYCIAVLIGLEKYYVTTEKQKRNIKILTILAIIFMIFTFSFANKGEEKIGLSYYEEKGITWNFSKQYFMPYMYITNGWTNLQYVTETQDSRTYGLWTIAPILGYTGLKENFTKELHLEPYSSFNTFSYVTCAFKDFGYWLSIIMSVILGFFVKKIYSRYLISRSPFDVACYVLTAIATVEMFFSNHFFMQSYPFTIVILMELYKKIIMQNKQIEIESD